MNLIVWVIIKLISLYQRFLSPLKGFSCAHRVMHGTESCSGYVKRVFIEQDLMTAISLSQTRFRDCSYANRVLNIESYQNSDGIKRRKFLRNFLFGSVAPVMGYSKFECCYNPSACCSAYTDDKDEDKKK